MKKLLSIFIFSTLLINPIFADDTIANTTDINISISDIENSITMLKQELKENNLKEELKDLKDLVTFLALKHIEYEQAKPESQSNESTINISKEEQNNAIRIIKTTFSKISGFGNFVLDKADKIISKKTFLALCLLLGPAAYIAPKLVGPIIKCIGKIFAKGGLIIGAKAAAGFKEAALENHELVTDIMTADLAIKGAGQVTNQVADKVIGAGFVYGIKKAATGLIANPVIATILLLPLSFLPIGPSLISFL